jgi:pyruvate formate lyase activating enzyme
MMPHFYLAERSLIYCSLPPNILRIGTAGCNLRCKFCIVWSISQSSPEQVEKTLLGGSSAGPFNRDLWSEASLNQKGEFYHSPEEIIRKAKTDKDKVIVFNINEPTVYYEYMLDVAKLAKKEGIATVLSTSGYINREPLRELLQYMDSVSIGLKGFTEDIYRKYTDGHLQPVLETLKTLKDEKIGFEIQYVVIPTVNDDPEQFRKMSLWIKENIGDWVPLHLYRFVPSHKMINLPPTPIETLERVKRIAEECGLRSVYFHYLGNFPSPDLEEKIFCPNCKALLLHRKGGKELLVNNVSKGRCKFCGYRVGLVNLE